LVKLRRCRRVAAPPVRSCPPAFGLAPRLEAIPGAATTIVRLTAPPSTLEQRIQLREPADPEGDLIGARWWTQHFNDVRVEDYVVETENRLVNEIAREVLRLVGWLP
jgi:hypothetical protein